MKNSRTSLNKPFYDWIKQVREADKKIVELEDKLYYYNVKLIGYNSPNFEPRLSSTKAEYKDNRYIWIDKINEIETEILEFKVVKLQYVNFLSTLSDTEVLVLEYFIQNNLTNLLISRSYKYYVLNKISVRYNKCKRNLIKNCENE